MWVLNYIRSKHIKLSNDETSMLLNEYPEFIGYLSNNILNLDKYPMNINNNMLKMLEMLEAISCDCLILTHELPKMKGITTTGDTYTSTSYTTALRTTNCAPSSNHNSITYIQNDNKSLIDNIMLIQHKDGSPYIIQNFDELHRDYAGMIISPPIGIVTATSMFITVPWNTKL